MLNPAEIFVLRKENIRLGTQNTKFKKSLLVRDDKIDKLKQENKRLKEELRNTQEELEKIREQRDKFKGMIFKPNIQKSTKDLKTSAKKRLGGQLDHKGASRKLPRRVDQVSRVFFHHCPDCGKELKRTDSYDSHAVEDIPIFFEDTKKIQVRMRNQGNNLITAILFEGVELTNNLAERGIRKAVVVRKISGGSRSNLGAETFAINMSVIQTIRMRNQPLIPTLHNLLLNGSLGNTN